VTISQPSSAFLQIEQNFESEIANNFQDGAKMDEMRIHHGYGTVRAEPNAVACLQAA
jgi:hypothetical protein